LATARQAGYNTQNGLGMLVHQGISAFEQWTGHHIASAHVPELLDALKSF